jgi:HAMP domain-containing protein
LEWYLISKINKNEVLSDLWPIVISIFIVTFLLFMVIVFVSLAISRKLTEPISMGADFATSISRGEFNKSIDINRKDELGQLARALKDMGKSLKEQEWLRRGKEGLDDTLRGEHDVKKVGYKFISFMVKHLNAQVGVFYLLEDDGFLHLSSSYAFTDRQGNFNKIALGKALWDKLPRRWKKLFIPMSQRIPLVLIMV